MHEEWEAYVHEMISKHVVFQNPDNKDQYAFAFHWGATPWHEDRAHVTVYECKHCHLPMRNDGLGVYTDSCLWHEIVCGPTSSTGDVVIDQLMNYMRVHTSQENATTIDQFYYHVVPKPSKKALNIVVESLTDHLILKVVPIGDTKYYNINWPEADTDDDEEEEYEEDE